MSSYSTSEIEMEFPFYDLKPFEQIVSTTFYSVEEIKERYIQFLQNQKERFFHIRILGDTNRPPIALMTPTVHDISVLPSVLKKAKLKSIKNNSKSVEQIEELSEARRKEILLLQSEGDDQDEIQDNPDDDRWQ